jgi:hypothetical protein
VPLGPFGYSRFTVYTTGAALTVYGSTLLLLREWPQFPAGLAFAATRALESALNPSCLGPSGAPMAWVAAGRQSWTEFVMVVADSQAQAVQEPATASSETASPVKL